MNQASQKQQLSRAQYETRHPQRSAVGSKARAHRALALGYSDFEPSGTSARASHFGLAAMLCSRPALLARATFGQLRLIRIALEQPLASAMPDE